MLPDFITALQGFRLNFHFGPNEYITDQVLTKDYEYTFSVDDCKPLDYDGPEIVACKGLVCSLVYRRRWLRAVKAV